MSDGTYRTGAPRDVPPPRPVPPPPAAVGLEETGLGRAARAVADAVAGLVGPSGPRPAEPTGTTDGGARSAATALRDVIGAVTGAVGSAFGPGRDADRPATEPTAGAADRSPSALFGELLATAAPRLPIRDAERLHAAYPGATEDEIADALVARAARLTSGIGAATGGIAAAHWFVPGSLLALPIELGAETVLIGGVEVVLVGELHELYGRSAAGDARERASAYVAAWSAQRSVDGVGATGLGVVLGTAGMRALSRRVTRRMAGAVPAAAPFLIGAALAGRGNRRATETLAERVLTDLRAPRPPRT